MIYTLQAKKVALYINTKKKTAAQIKTETGCDVLINGGLYDMKTFKPVLYLKNDGTYLSRVWDGSKPYGFGWSTGKADITMSQDHAKFNNFISCTEICRDGKKVSMSYDSRGGKRGRSAFGVTKNGQVSIICTSDSNGAMTPETLQSYALEQGWKDGIMLDGGGSCQCITPIGKVTSSRIVQNYICVWESDSVKTYSKSKNGATKLSANFTVKEFAVAGSDVVQIDTALVSLLQNIRTHFGKAVNIKKTASHAPDAVNITVNGVTTREIAQYAENIGAGEVGLESTSVYIAASGNKVYWDKTSDTKKAVSTFMEDTAKTVQDRFGLDDATMTYLKGYKFADALLKKLATAK